MALHNVSFNLLKGEILGILGESGSGKSTVGWSIMGMIESPHKISGEIMFDNDTNVLKMSYYKMQKYRWTKVAMVFQASMNSFDPLTTVGRNFSQLLLEKGISKNKEDAKKNVIRLFRHFNLPDEIYNYYPFELSGGMKQRISIAVAISCNPQVLIADEPTTALDTVSQFTVLNTLETLIKNHEINSMIFITHDVTVQLLIADRIMVMEGGHVVEIGTKDEISKNPKHPYVAKLFSFSFDEGHVPSGIAINRIKNEVKDPKEFKGCPFATLCPYTLEICFEEFPSPWVVTSTHTVYCHLYNGGVSNSDRD